jgi:hypothetical protein
MKQRNEAEEPPRSHREDSNDAIWVPVLEQVGDDVAAADASGRITFVN